MVDKRQTEQTEEQSNVVQYENLGFNQSLSQLNVCRMNLQQSGINVGGIDFNGLRRKLPAPENLNEGSKARTIIEKLNILIIKVESQFKKQQNNIYSFPGTLKKILTYVMHLHQTLSNLQQKKRYIDAKRFSTELDYISKSCEEMGDVIAKINESTFEESHIDELVELKNEISNNVPKEIVNEDQFRVDLEKHIQKYKDDYLALQQVKTHSFNQAMNQLFKLQTEKTRHEEERISIQKEIGNIQMQIIELKSQVQKKESNVQKILEDIDQKQQAIADSYQKDDDNYLNKIKDFHNKAQNILLEKHSELAQIQVESECDQNNFHFIIIADDSGSMGNFFGDLKESFKQFVKIIYETQNRYHRLSTVMFNSYSSIVHQNVEVTLNLEINPKGGGTDFKPAFQDFEKLVQLNRLMPVLIFMTDGQDSNGAKFAEDILKKQYANQKMYTFCIGFGNGCDENSLKKICMAGNGGVILRQIQGKQVNLYQKCMGQNNELQKVFSLISSNFNKAFQDKQKQIELLKGENDKMLNQLKKGAIDFRNTQEEMLRNRNQRSEELRKIASQNASNQISSINNYIKKNENDLKILEKRLSDVISKIEENHLHTKENQKKIDELLVDEGSHTSEVQSNFNLNPEETKGGKQFELVSEKLYHRFQRIQQSQYDKFKQDYENGDSFQQKLFEGIKSKNESLSKNGFSFFQEEDFKNVHNSIEKIDDIIWSSKKYIIDIVAYLNSIKDNLEFSQQKINATQQMLEDEKQLDAIEASEKNQDVTKKIVLQILQQQDQTVQENDSNLIKRFIATVISESKADEHVKEFITDHFQNFQSLSPLQEELKKHKEEYEERAKQVLAEKMSQVEQEKTIAEDIIRSIEKKVKANDASRDDLQELKAQQNDLKRLNKIKNDPREVKALDQAAQLYQKIMGYLQTQRMEIQRLEQNEDMTLALEAMSRGSIPNINVMLEHKNQNEKFLASIKQQERQQAICAS